MFGYNNQQSSPLIIRISKLGLKLEARYLALMEELRYTHKNFNRKTRESRQLGRLGAEASIKLKGIIKEVVWPCYPDLTYA
jgi:hypothetical protein